VVVREPDPNWPIITREQPLDRADSECESAALSVVVVTDGAVGQRAEVETESGHHKDAPQGEKDEHPPAPPLSTSTHD
jgi:hypothetical protein